MIKWTFNDPKGKRLHDMQTENTLDGFELAGTTAQQLANKHATTIAFTAWIMDREGATAYRYPRSRGRPAKENALTGAQRIKRLRDHRKEQGLCPCCGQELPTIKKPT